MIPLGWRELTTHLSNASSGKKRVSLKISPMPDGSWSVSAVVWTDEADPFKHEDKGIGQFAELEEAKKRAAVWTEEWLK